MFKKFAKFLVLFASILLTLIITQNVSNIYASELHPKANGETIEHLSQAFSMIDEEGKRFLFPDEDANTINSSNVQVGRGIKTYYLQNEHLEDSGIMQYPLYNSRHVFALYIERYDENGVNRPVSLGSIKNEIYYGEDIDYSDVTIVAEGNNVYVVSSSFIWHYEDSTFVSKTSRDELKDNKEQQIDALIKQIDESDTDQVLLAPVQNNQLQEVREDFVTKQLGVLVVPQHQSPTCWAAAVCAVGNYMTGLSNWTPDAISMQVKGKITGGEPEDYIKGFLLFEYSESKRKVASSLLEYPLNDTEIMNWIDHDTPFILSLKTYLKPNSYLDQSGHALAACGYTSSAFVSTLYVQDSATATRQALFKGSSGTFEYTLNGKVFVWYKTIVLTGWQKPNNGNEWVYFNANGTYKTGWLDELHNYYLDFDGHPKRGWFKENGKWYLTDSEGAVQKGWAKQDGSWYYFSGSGEMQTGWVYVDGYWYYLDDSGRLLYSQWLLESGRYYYLDSDGKMLTGWFKYQGYSYYLDSNGVMQTGWLNDGGNWYYLNSNGSMRTGWLVKDGSYYYLDSNGRMITGWYRISGDWYFFNSDGSMATGWLERGGSWYYLSSSGIMQTGWLNSSGHTFYLNQDGSMRTGWLSYGGSSYYLRYDNNQPVSGGPTGSMIYSQKARIGGVIYEFNARGEAHKALPGNIVPKAYKPLVEAA